MKKKDFIKSAKNSFKCDLTVDDIISKTDYFDKPEEEILLEQQTSKTLFYRKSLITSNIALALTVLIFVFTLIFSIKTINNLNSEQRIVHVKDDKAVLTKDAELYMQSLSSYVSTEAYYYIFFYSKYSIYIYQGKDINENGEKTYSYFYLVDGICNDGEILEFEVNGSLFDVSSDQNFGLLVDDLGNNHKITLKISCRNVTKNYVLEG